MTIFWKRFFLSSLFGIFLSAIILSIHEEFQIVFGNPNLNFQRISAFFLILFTLFLVPKKKNYFYFSSIQKIFNFMLIGFIFLDTFNFLISDSFYELDDAFYISSFLNLILFNFIVIFNRYVMIKNLYYLITPTFIFISLIFVIFTANLDFTKYSTHEFHQSLRIGYDGYINNINYWSSSLSFILLISFYCMINSYSYFRYSIVLFSLILFLVVSCVLLSFSRSGILSFAIVFVLLIALQRKQLNSYKMLILICFSFFVLYIILYNSIFIDIIEIMNKRVIALSEGDESAIQRIKVYSIVFNLLGSSNLRELILGHGVGLSQLYSFSSENALIGILVKFGLLGFLFFLVTCIYVGYKIYASIQLLKFSDKQIVWNLKLWFIGYILYIFRLFLDDGYISPIVIVLFSLMCFDIERAKCRNANIKILVKYN